MPRALAMPEPYRLMFPLGLFYALLAALVWPMYAAGWIPYPATLHWTLMVQGFLHCFVLGFLLTAMPAFLHADKARPWETAGAFNAMIIFGVSAIAGWAVAAQAAYLATIALVIQAAVRRFPNRRGDPPEEFVLVALGMAFALAGALYGIGTAAGWWADPAPRFTLHLFTQGMMLAIVLGLGGLLVPTFSGMKQPLVIPGVAKPGERIPRRWFYAIAAILLISAIVFTAMGSPAAAARIRLLPALVMTLLVWKLFRRPGPSGLLAWTIWSSGWFVLAGLSIAAVVPARAIVGFHFVFLGGFGLLIQGIATRVIVNHGGHGIEAEKRVLRLDSVIAIVLALAVRVVSEFAPHNQARYYGISGLLWIIAWSIWGFRALPRIVLRGRLPRFAKPDDIRPQGFQVSLSEVPPVRRHM